METKKSYGMKIKSFTILLLLFALMPLSELFAEGSGNWKGTQTNRRTYLFVPDLITTNNTNTNYTTRGYMMLPSSTDGYDPGHRFLVYVKQGETVYFAFNSNNSGRSIGWYYDNRATGANNKFPDGTSDQGRVAISLTGRTTTNSTSNFTQSMALAGPRPIAGSSGYAVVGTGNNIHGGYFTNTTNEDRAFWLEFNGTNNNHNYNNEIHDWDVTVVNNNNEVQTGRVYCKYWSILNGLPGSWGGTGSNTNNHNTTSGGNSNATILEARSNTTSFHDNFGFYVPVDNTNPNSSGGYYIKQILFPGANTGYGVFFANDTGPRDGLTLEENRKSISGTSNRFQFPLFVGLPDQSIWFPAQEPYVNVVPVFSRRTLDDQQNWGVGPGGKAEFTVTVNNPGAIDILIDLDGDGVYSDTDVIVTYELPYNESLGGNQTFVVVWDGKDSDGVDVPSGANVKFISMTTFFPVHFPVYDMEQSRGVEVKHIAPNPTDVSQVLFWDHSAFKDITTNPTNSRQYGNAGSTPIAPANVVHVNVTGLTGDTYQWWAHGNYGVGNDNTMNFWAGGSASILEEEYAFYWDANDLEVRKSVDSEYAEAGDVAEFTIMVFNNGLQDATNVVVTDTLPAGLLYVSHDNYGIGTVSLNGSIITWNVGDMEYKTPVADNGHKLTIFATVQDSGPYDNKAEVDSDDTDPVKTNDKSTVTIKRTGIKLIKEITNQPVTPLEFTVGQTINYKFTVTNTGEVELTNIELDDALLGFSDKDFMTLVGFSGDSNSDNILDTDETWIATATYVVKQADIDAGTLLNEATVKGLNPIAKEVNASDDVTTTFTPNPDLTFVKTASIQDSKPKAYVGDKITYTFTVKNTGNVSLSEISVSDNLVDLGTITPASVTSLAPNAIATFTAEYTVTMADIVSGEVENIAIASAKDSAGDPLDPAPSSYDSGNPGKPTTLEPGETGYPGKPTVVPTMSYSDLMVEKTVNNSTPFVGTNVVFTITVANNGPHDATGVEVTDLLPSGYTYVSHTPTGTSYVNTTGIWTVGDLDKGESLSLNITAEVNPSGIYENTASITGNDNPDHVESNNQDVVDINPILVYAKDDYAQTPQTYPVSGNVLSNDAGLIMVTGATVVVGGTTITITPGTSATLTGIGTILINNDGSYTFTPEPSFTGTVPPISYTGANSGGSTAMANLNIQVIPVYNPQINNPPVAIDDHVRGRKNEDLSGNILSNDSDPDGEVITVTEIEVPNLNNS